MKQILACTYPVVYSEFRLDVIGEGRTVPYVISKAARIALDCIVQLTDLFISEPAGSPVLLDSHKGFPARFINIFEPGLQRAFAITAELR